MTETRILDYSFARPAPATIKASGAVGVMRYLCRSDPKTSKKPLTLAEVSTLHRAGLSIGLVFEDGAQRAKGGLAAGKADATFAAKMADGLGVPNDVPIFYAVDFDATVEQVRAYFEGIKAARTAHPIGVYGSKRVVEGILTLGYATYAWQTAAWSGGKLSTKAHLYQRVKATHPVAGTDENVLLKTLPMWAAAKPPAKTPAKAPAPKPAAKPTPAPKVPAKVPPKVQPKGLVLTPAQVSRLQRHHNLWTLILRLLGLKR